MGITERFFARPERLYLPLLEAALVLAGAKCCGRSKIVCYTR